MQWIETDSVRAQMPGQINQRFEVGEIPYSPIAARSNSVELDGQQPATVKIASESCLRSRDQYRLLLNPRRVDKVQPIAAHRKITRPDDETLGNDPFRNYFASVADCPAHRQSGGVPKRSLCAVIGPDHDELVEKRVTLMLRQQSQHVFQRAHINHTTIAPNVGEFRHNSVFFGFVEKVHSARRLHSAVASQILQPGGESSFALTLRVGQRSQGNQLRTSCFVYRSGAAHSHSEWGRRFHVNGITVNKTTQTVESAESGGPFHIEDVYPLVDGGRFPVKRIVGEPVEIWADIYRDGHNVVSAALIWRRELDREWRRESMALHSNDRWSGSFLPDQPGRYVYAIEAWTDEFATWRRGFELKQKAGADVTLDAIEGAGMLTKAQSGGRDATATIVRQCKEFLRTGDTAALLTPELTPAMAESQSRPDLTRSKQFPFVADRPRARYGAWYEMVPRSQGKVLGQHGTFQDCTARLPDIAAMGFDVVYLTPIHPIGQTNRKGRNNAVNSAEGDPGSPYAIGSAEGGHDAVHPQLGTLEDFREFVEACRRQGMEVALDFAVQCSPDHPWLKQHPQWFKRRPDGSMRYAENPPKKYEDIVNPDFSSEDAGALWNALRDVVLFWIAQGVAIFRVDNPHTKPFRFWEWLIHEVQLCHPEVIFLAEAFTRPKLMKGLAKLGFTQSYTYFTWRTQKWELEQYLSELTAYPERDFYRPNFFVNTPDILPYHLQGGESWMFKSRVALAATLSATYGIYSGFELLEHDPIPGREEYLNSEKYEIKVRDWDKPGNIKPYIRDLNRVRRENPALQQTSQLRFIPIDDGNVIGFVKDSIDRTNIVAAAIALSGDVHEFWLPLGDVQIGADHDRRPVAALENLITGERYPVQWGGIRLRIDPMRDPAYLFRCLG
jgi:starch synthase (maltosyl-transferring)